MRCPDNLRAFYSTFDCRVSFAYDIAYSVAFDVYTAVHAIREGRRDADADAERDGESERHERQSLLSAEWDGIVVGRCQ